MSKQLEANRQSLLDSFYLYYQAKIASRETFENLTKISKNNFDYSKFELIKDGEEILRDSYEPVKNLMFILRNNLDYTTKLIEIIQNKCLGAPENKASIDSFVEFICHQLYENILIPNPEQEELLILFSLLIKKEMEKMFTVSLDTFIEDSSILGKLFTCFSKNPEINNFLAKSIEDVAFAIDNNEHNTLHLNPLFIKSLIMKNENIQEMMNNTINLVEDECLIREKIPRTSIKIELNPQNVKEENINLVEPRGEKNIDLYQIELNQDMFNVCYLKEDNPLLKVTYENHIRKSYQKPNKFTNKYLLESFKFCEDAKLIVMKEYRENFIFIKTQIDNILQKLIKKISAIPYIVRCLCKMINMFTTKKFPHLNKIQQNAFIGELIFGKFIIPTINNIDSFGYVSNNILQPKTIYTLKNISKLLKNISRGELFDNDTEPGFTFFNYYILELIPILDSFYSKLIDVKLPRVLDKVVNDQINEFEMSIFRKAKKPETSRQRSLNINYNYFEEKKKEAINIQCACFSIQDIFFIQKICSENLDEFKSFQKFIFFQRTLEKISNNAPDMETVISTNPNKKLFFLVFKDFENPKLEMKKIDEGKALSSGEDANQILQNVKFCIKNVLKGLNTINTRDYPYLSSTKKNSDFFLALKMTLNDLEDDSEIESSTAIPLKWYSQYLINNINMLPEKYQQNDFECLYDEIFKEKMRKLAIVVRYTTKNLIRRGMNLRCAEKLVEKVKRDLAKMNKIKNHKKTQKFVKNVEVNACLTLKKDILNKEQANNKNNSSVENEGAIIVENGKTCIHKKMEKLQQIAAEKNKKSFDSFLFKINEHHADNISSFIEKIKKYGKNDCNLQEDILYGKTTVKFYKTLADYLVLVKDSINKSKIFTGDTEDEKKIAIEWIEDHILKQLYKNFFPSEPIERDKEFCQKTQQLSTITPQELGVKKVYVNELEIAVKSISKIDLGKSIYEKIKCIAAAYNTINNTLKLSTGKDEGGGADDFCPIFQYLIIKAHPQRFFSNINYIKSTLNPSKHQGRYGFLMSQLEFAAEFITKFSEKEKNEH